MCDDDGLPPVYPRPAVCLDSEFLGKVYCKYSTTHTTAERACALLFAVAIEVGQRQSSIVQDHQAGLQAERSKGTHQRMMMMMMMMPM